MGHVEEAGEDVHSEDLNVIAVILFRLSLYLRAGILTEGRHGRSEGGRR